MKFTKAELDALERLRRARIRHWQRHSSRPGAGGTVTAWRAVKVENLSVTHPIVGECILSHRAGDAGKVCAALDRMERQ